MKKIVTLLSITIIIFFGCTTVDETSSNPTSDQNPLGKRVTKQTSYLYGPDKNGVFAITNWIHEGGNGIDETGSVRWQKREPSKIVPQGTTLDVNRIEKKETWGVEHTVAYGTLHLRNESFPIVYGSLIDTKFQPPWDLLTK